MLLIEKVVEHYYKSSPSERKDYVTAVNTTGLEGPKIMKFVEDLYQAPNFYDNYVTILDKSFPSPLNDNYKFNYNRIFNYDRIEGGRESGCDGRNSIENEMLINFKDLSFEEFARYWKLYKGFRDLQPFNYGYDIEILNKFITNFINKYNDREGYSYLGINPSIIDFLKLEAFDIFNTLAHYFPKDSKYCSDIPENINRNSIKEYLFENGVSF